MRFLSAFALLLFLAVPAGANFTDSPNSYRVDSATGYTYVREAPRKAARALKRVRVAPAKAKAVKTSPAAPVALLEPEIMSVPTKTWMDRAFEMLQQNALRLRDFIDRKQEITSEVRPEYAPPRPWDTSLPRGIRNNNPGNIEASKWTQSQPGYIGSDGRFAIFDTRMNGFRAMEALLLKYAQEGRDTPIKIISKWAPASDCRKGKGCNPVGLYAMSVAKELGVTIHTPLDMKVPHIRSRTAYAMAKFENGPSSL